MTTGASWIDELWRARIAEMVTARLEAEQTVYVPAWYWVGKAGVPSYGPLSFVAGVMRPLPKVMNLDKLHRRVLELSGVKPL